MKGGEQRRLQAVRVADILKAALLLPLLTVPQVLVIGWALNVAG